jgi:hypothetical protein
MRQPSRCSVSVMSVSSASVSCEKPPACVDAARRKALIAPGTTVTQFQAV